MFCPGLYLLISFAFGTADPVVFGQQPMVKIPAGSYVPLYAKEKEGIAVEEFFMDVYPVTNAEFDAFVASHPQWSRERVKEIFADERYLSHWTAATDDSAFAAAPVTNVSWFASKTYCECLGKQLPTTDQWEYAASAGRDGVNGSADSSLHQKILDWYAKPASGLPQPVQSAVKNFYGVAGLHGLIWEWTLDFNSMVLGGDSREAAEIDKNFFCGAGAAGTSDTRNYAAYMRFAFRASLEADFCIGSLGFRCVKNKAP